MIRSGFKTRRANLRTFPNRVRSWLNLEWVFPDDLYSAASSEVTPTLFLGGRPNQGSVAELSASNITHVVSCMQERHRSQVYFLQSDFEHLFLAANDEMQEDLADTFQKFFDHTDDVWANNPAAKIFVHCEAGVSRSASLVIAFLMKSEGLSFMDAFELVRSKRFQVLPNIGFASQLQRLEHELQPNSRSTSPSSLARYLREICNAPVDVDVLQAALERHDYNAPAALIAIFGGEIPRVAQGVRSMRT